MRFLSILRRLKYLTPRAYLNSLNNSYLPFYLSHFELFDKFTLLNYPLIVKITVK